MAKNNSGGMTPGSRGISKKAVKAGVKQMDKAKAQAAWKTDAAKLIKPSKPASPYNTVASLTRQIKQYQSYLSSGKVPAGLTRARINSALDSMSEQLASMKSGKKK